MISDDFIKNISHGMYKLITIILNCIKDKEAYN